MDCRYELIQPYQPSQTDRFVVATKGDLMSGVACLEISPCRQTVYESFGR